MELSGDIEDCLIDIGKVVMWSHSWVSLTGAETLHITYITLHSYCLKEAGFSWGTVMSHNFIHQLRFRDIPYNFLTSIVIVAPVMDLSSSMNDLSEFHGDMIQISCV